MWSTTPSERATWCGRTVCAVAPAGGHRLPRSGTGGVAAPLGPTPGRGRTAGVPAGGRCVRDRGGPGQRRCSAALWSTATEPQAWIGCWDEDGFSARVDFLFRGQRTVVEFDGLAKYRTPHDLRAEKVREDRVRTLGYEVVRLTWADLARPAEVHARIVAAFARASREPAVTPGAGDLGHEPGADSLCLPMTAGHRCALLEGAAAYRSKAPHGRATSAGERVSDSICCPSPVRLRRGSRHVRAVRHHVTKEAPWRHLRRLQPLPS